MDIGQTIAPPAVEPITINILKNREITAMEIVGTSHAYERSRAVSRRAERGLAYEDIADGIHDCHLLGRSRCARGRDVGWIRHH